MPPLGATTDFPSNATAVVVPPPTAAPGPLPTMTKVAFSDAVAAPSLAPKDPPAVASSTLEAKPKIAAAASATKPAAAAKAGAAAAPAKPKRSASASGRASSAAPAASKSHADPLNPAPRPPAINGPSMLAAATNGIAEPFVVYRAADPFLKGGLLDVRDFSGRSVLHLAAWHGHSHVLHELLRPLGGTAPAVDWTKHVSKQGNTVLHAAAQGGHIAAVQLVTQQRHAHVMAAARNRRNESPQQAAETYQQHDAAQFLIRFHSAEPRAVPL